MSKRYYYTDPLAAAWMTRHFSMGLIINNSNGLKMPSLDFNWFSLSEADIKKYGLKYQVHHASLPLLDPQVGDLGLFVSEENGEYFDNIVSFCKNRKDWARHDGREMDESWFIKIIQRNGIPFMWPEVEE